MGKFSDHRELIVVLVAFGLLAAYIIIPTLPTRAQSNIVVASDLWGGSWTQIRGPDRNSNVFYDADLDSASTSEMARSVSYGMTHVVVRLYIFKTTAQAEDGLSLLADSYSQQNRNVTLIDIGDNGFYNATEDEWQSVFLCFYKGTTMVAIEVHRPHYDPLFELREIAFHQIRKLS